MGSAASKGISRQAVFEETSETRNVLNLALNYMIKELNIRDFYKLSNPRECSKYVLFLANKLSESFYTLDLVPSFKNGGRVYFRPIKQLTEPSDEEKTERQSLCLFLSYFFVRIFQISSALTLTLRDDISVVAKSGALTDMPGMMYRDTGPSRSLGTPGFEGRGGIFPYGETRRNSVHLPSLNWDRRNRNRNTRRNIWSGGGSSVSLPPVFQFLKKYIVPGMNRAQGIEIGYQLQDGKGNRGVYYFKPNQRLFGSQNTGFLYSKFKGHSNALFELQIVGLGNNKIRLSGVNYRNPQGDSSKKDVDSDTLNRMLDNRTEFQFISYGNDVYGIDIQGQQKTPYSFFKRIIEHVMDEVNDKLGKRSSSSSSGYDQGYRQESERRKDPFTSIFRSSESDRPKGVDQSFYEADKSAPPAMKMTGTLAALGTTMPVPRCIGRAIQLLKTRPDVNGLVESDICSSKFLVGEDSRVEASRPGEGLDRSPSFMALVQTFYEFVQYKNPAILMDLKDTLEPYKRFMVKLAERYEMTYDMDERQKQKVLEETQAKIEKTANPDSVKRLAKMELDMKDRRMEKLCTTLTEDGKVLVEPAVAQDVQESVSKLLRTQLLHVANCAKILNQLFLIKGSGAAMGIEIHPNLFKKGMPELDRINNLARDLLVTYYEQCEAGYMEGVEKIAAASMRRRNATRRAANNARDNDDNSIRGTAATVAGTTVATPGATATPGSGPVPAIAVRPPAPGPPIAVRPPIAATATASPAPPGPAPRPPIAGPPATPAPATPGPPRPAAAAPVTVTTAPKRP